MRFKSLKINMFYAYEKECPYSYKTALHKSKGKKRGNIFTKDVFYLFLFQFFFTKIAILSTPRRPNKRKKPRKKKKHQSETISTVNYKLLTGSPGGPDGPGLPCGPVKPLGPRSPCGPGTPDGPVNPWNRHMSVLCIHRYCGNEIKH